MSVCLSICLSFTRQYSFETSKHINLFSLLGSHIILHRDYIFNDKLN